MGARSRRRVQAGLQPAPLRARASAPVVVDAAAVVPIDAFLERGQAGPRSLVRLEDGTIGYCMARTDECFRAALATTIQVPVDQVFDVQLDQRLLAGHSPEAVNAEHWARFAAFLDARGLEAAFSADVPLDCERWIGVTGQPPAEAVMAVAQSLGGSVASPFAAHSLVMTRDRILFNPAVSIEAPWGFRAPEFQPSDVQWGVEIRAKE